MGVSWHLCAAGTRESPFAPVCYLVDDLCQMSFLAAGCADGDWAGAEVPGVVEKEALAIGNVSEVWIRLEGDAAEVS